MDEFAVYLVTTLSCMADIITIVDAFRQIKKETSKDRRLHRKRILLVSMVIALFGGALYLTSEAEKKNIILPAISIVENYLDFNFSTLLKWIVIISFLVVCIFKLVNFIYFHCGNSMDDTCFKEHTTYKTLTKKKKANNKKQCKRDEKRSKNL